MYLLLLFISSTICFSEQEVYIDAYDYDLWIYYSFESESEIVINNPESSLDWDIAFKRNHIKTNSGLSGIGNAGGYVNEFELWNEELWDSFDINVHELYFEVDELIDFQIFPVWIGCYCNQQDQVGCEDQQDEPGYPFIDCIKNPALDRWGDWSDCTSQSCTFEVNDYILIIKTVNDRYFQFWPSDYYGPNCPGLGGGCITFKYKEICYLEPGDVNRDNQISVSDIILSIEYIINVTELDECQIIASDINQDSNTNIIDVVKMAISRILR